jgi:hypothetical protein
VGLVIASASLCFSVWVAIAHPRPGGFFVRYGPVSLGIAVIVAFILATIDVKSPSRKWLWAIWGLAFAVSCVGIIQSYR